MPGEWNEFDVPENEVTEQAGQRQILAVVHPVCSR